jgi:chemotaxis protein histidine kinase CheA
MVQTPAPGQGTDSATDLVARFDVGGGGLLDGKGELQAKEKSRSDALRAIKVLDDYPKSTLEALKYAIFIVDCNNAAVMVQSKPSGVEELKFRAVEALGLRASEEAVRMELIFAGYDGPERFPLYTDEQLERFLLSLPQDLTGQSKGDAAVKAALAVQRAEYEKQIRELNEKLEDLSALCKKLKDRNTELEEEAERMVEQMKVRLEQAEIDIEKRCRKEFKKQLAAKEAEFKAKLDELRQKYSAMKKAYEAECQKVKDLEAEVEKLEGRLADELAIKKKLQARIKELEPFVAKCDQLKAEADLWRKRYEQLLKECEREDDPPRLEDSNTFEWAIPGMTGKLKFPKGRAIQSPEFQIAGLKEPVQIEFFPRGDNTTWDGWCALKIRVPDETQLLWSAWVGTARAGPRLDLFDQNSWWCRQGLLWSNFALVHDLMAQIDDADTVICGIEVHAVGPFAREDPERPLGLTDGERPRSPSPPRKDRVPNNPTRTDPAAQQWQAFGFLEVDDESPRPMSKGGNRWGPGTPTRKNRGQLEPLNASWSGRRPDQAGIGLSRSIQSRSESRLNSRTGTPMALQDATLTGFRPPSPDKGNAYQTVGRWTPQALSPAASRPGSRAQ